MQRYLFAAAVANGANALQQEAQQTFLTADILMVIAGKNNKRNV